MSLFKGKEIKQLKEDVLFILGQIKTLQEHAISEELLKNDLLSEESE